MVSVSDPIVSFSSVDVRRSSHPVQMTCSTCRFSAAFALRQRMLNFVQNIQYYMMFEVMEPTWHLLENNLKTVSGRDIMLSWWFVTLQELMDV